MRQRLLLTRWPGRLLIVAMALMTLGVGFCLFDGDEHGSDDGVSFDLCFGLAIVSLVVVVLRFVPIYALVGDAPAVLHAVPLHRLDPPPKSRSLS